MGKPKLTSEEKRKLTIESIDGMMPEVKQMAEEVYNENVSLGGSLSKYSSFVEYFEAEIMNFD